MRTRELDGTIASSKTEKDAARARVRASEVEDSYFEARRVVPTSSHKKLMAEYFHTPSRIRRGATRADGLAIYVIDELFVDDVHTTTKDVEGQIKDDRKIMAKIKVTYHT